MMEMMSIKEHPPLHVPVLLDDVLAELHPTRGENYLDLTAGYGGHARAILEKTSNYAESYLVDRDEMTYEHLADLIKKGASLLQTDFVGAARMLIEEGRQFSLILLDLGVSSPQLDRAERGFSFTHDGPLDMRMDRRLATTAADFVNRRSRDEIIRIIRDYGEERPGQAKRYADAIIAGRPFQTTGQLADAIKNAHVGKWQKTHPATRTFQAIRIAINDELAQVEAIMPLLPRLLKKDGRVGVISFHSLEDRIVKRYFVEQRDAGLESELSITTKKPIAGDTHDVHNPRSRSAKLRVAVKK